MPQNNTPEAPIALFKGKMIRKVLFNKEWWFSIIDVVAALTDSTQPSKYWTAMKARVTNEDGIQLSTICRQLKIRSADGKQYSSDCADTEGIFRIVQSIPSPKAEPFKRWLAKVGYERVQEIENPELGSKRTKMLYRLKGYPEKWIEQRVRGIEVREELTNEWDNRGASHEKDYEILTAEIAKATFEVTPQEHKKLKGLKKENLRDHMSMMELLLTSLGEQTTAELHQTKNSQGVPQLKTDARIGGQIAGSTRKQIERTLGKSVISKKNFLPPKGQIQKKPG